MLQAELKQKWLEQKDVVIHEWVELLKDRIDDCIEVDGGSGSVEPSASSQPCCSSVPVFSGESFTDRRSRFQAFAARVRSLQERDRVLSDLRQSDTLKAATHLMVAYRIQHNGQLHENRDDNGETGAGDRMLYLLQKMEVLNVIIVVCLLHFLQDIFPPFSSVSAGCKMVWWSASWPCPFST